MCGRMMQFTATLRYRDGAQIAIARMDDPGNVIEATWCGHIRSENTELKASMKPVVIPGVTMVRHYIRDMEKGYVREYNEDQPVTLSGYARWIKPASGGAKFVGVFVETRDVSVEGHSERWPVVVGKEPEYKEHFEEGRD